VRAQFRAILKSTTGKVGIALLVFQFFNDVISLLANAELVGSLVENALRILATPIGNLGVIIVAAILILWGVGRSQRHQTEPPSIPQQTQPPPEADSLAELQRFREENEQVKARLTEAQQTIKVQEERLSEWDGDRQRFKHFLLEAWSEGTNLGGGNPSKEEAREWESHVRQLLEQARGKEFANKILSHDPNFQSADFDASDAQKFLEMRLQRVDQLSKNVTKSRAIQFRPGFDPYEWKDWKSPPSTSSTDSDPHQIPEHMIAERHIRYHEAPIPLVDLLEAVGDNGVLRDFQFEHCTLEGPGIINLEGPFPKPETTTSDSGSFGRASISVGPTHCRVEGSPDTTLYRVTHDSKPPVGTIHLSGCTLQSVTFKGLGFAGTPEYLEQLEKQLIFSEGNNAPALGPPNNEYTHSGTHKG
jgi:hypothetical protein